MKYKNNKQSKYKKLPKCSKCKSENVIKWGKRRTDNRGKVQRYKCKDCQNTFVFNDGFLKMRNSPQKITLCLDLFYRGLSTREIQNHLQSFYPHNSSNVSIYKWIVKYAKKISDFTDKLKIHSGYNIQIDEMMFHRRKSNKEKLGAEENWFIDSIDTKTRFIVSSQFVKSRGQEEIIKVLNKAKEKTEKQVTRITTDGYTAYEGAIRQSFGLVDKNKFFGVQHRRINASKGEGFNIMIERLHNSIRQRTHGFRGLHGSIESANVIMRGLEIYYNFIRKHESLKGRTPSELACPELKFENPNRWLELIKLSNKNNLK